MTPTADDLESPFFFIHGRDPLEGCTRLLGSGNIRCMGNNKGLILFAELCKLWLSHTKSFQENRLLKTETLEQNKHFKSHNFKVGQLIAVKNHLRNTFETRFISDYRILKTINECTLLIKNPDGKTRKNNINDAKPVSAITAMDNALQEFRQLMLRRNTLTLMHYIVPPHKYVAAQQLRLCRKQDRLKINPEMVSLNLCFPSSNTDNYPPHHTLL